MAELDKYRDLIRPLRSATAGLRPDPTQMKPGEMFVNTTDRVFSFRDESDDNILHEIAGLEPEYRDSMVNNEIFLPKSGVVNDITYNTAFFETTENVINITDTSPSIILADYITSNLTINIEGIKDVTNKIIKVYITKSKDVKDDLVITWNGVSNWLSDDDTAPRWGEGGKDSDLIVCVFITGDIVICNTIYNTENPVMSGSAFINWGQIKGTITDQVDLANLFNTKIDITEVKDKYVTKINAQVTDKITVGV